MSLSLRLLAVSAAFAFAGTAFAASPATPAATKPHTAQQQRMIDCNHQATDKKGAERKAFMSSCLKGHASASAATGTTQRTKMKSCNADATSKALKGADRKAFMSSCLKGEATAH